MRGGRELRQVFLTDYDYDYDYEQEGENEKRDKHYLFEGTEIIGGSPAGPRHSRHSVMI